MLPYGAMREIMCGASMDELDLQILSELVHDGRLSMSKLSDAYSDLHCLDLCARAGTASLCLEVHPRSQEASSTTRSEFHEWSHHDGSDSAGGGNAADTPC